MTRPHAHTAWKDLPHDFQELVTTELGPRQLTAYQLRQGGMRQWDISLTMGVALSTVQATLKRADQKIYLAIRAREETTT